METQLLRDPSIIPSAEVLNDVLGSGTQEAFECLMGTITGTEYGLTYEWNYYDDGKSWLCKVSHKKKTVFWLSVWDGFFKAGFYFTEKHLEGIAALDIAESTKENFCKAKPVGKLLPMIFNISHKEQLNDLLKVVVFKKSLK